MILKIIICIKSIGVWLSEAKLVFMCLLLIIAAILLGFYTWNTEGSARLAGYALQLIGMIFATNGLLKIRSFFGQPSLLKLISSWLKRFPIGNRGKVLSAAASITAMSAMEGRASSWHADSPDSSIEERIEAIVVNLKRVHEEQEIHFEKISNIEKDLTKHKQRSSEEIKTFKNDIKTEFKSLHTNDLANSIAGLILLTVGITLSTLAPELNRLIQIFEYMKL